MHRSVVISGVVAAVAALAISGAALAAGGGFGSPGVATFRDVTASAQVSDPGGGLIFVSLDRGMQSFRVRGVAGPPVMVGPETVLNYSGNLADGSFVGGCFVIPNSSFIVATDLSSAALNVDPSVETPCPGALVPADSGGRPGQVSVVPDAGGGGGGGTPVTATLAWTSDGAVTTSNISIDTRCGVATAHTTATDRSTPATLAGTFSALPDGTGMFAGIQDSSSRQIITAQFAAACFSAQ